MYKLFLISVIIIVFNFETHPQISVNTSEKFNERGYLNSSSKFGEGNEVISDYDGNFNLVYMRDMNLPNSMNGKITLVYNPNVEHRVFMDLNWADQEGYPVNTPEWIIGFNEFALQTFNFEVNFYSHKAGNINDRINLSGEQTPLLIPGYHYTNKIWLTHNGLPADYNDLDVIQILMADGSKTTLYNTIPHRFDGTYIQSGTDQIGYAKVKTYNQEKMLREMWYKKGDGLTYYFIEENLKYVDAPTNVNQFKTKAMYLRRVFNSYGDTLLFNYNNDTVYYNSLSNVILPDSIGRKLFSNIQISYQSTFTSGYMTRDLIPQSRLFELEYISLLLPPFAGLRPIILRQVMLQNFWNDDNIKLNLLESNSTGSAWYSPGRQSDVYNSKIKMISSITDKIGRRDIVTYQPSVRNYSYGGQDPLFSFSTPAYLLTEIKYDNNKKVQVDYLTSSIIYDYSLASNYMSDNDPFLWATKRDKRTNFMINTKKIYSVDDGINNLINTIQMNYGRDDGNSPFDPRVPVGECWTKIITTNSQVGDDSSPSSVTIKKTFTKIAIGERANHSQDYSSTIKLSRELIEENQTSLIEKKYHYALGNLISGYANFEFYTGSLWTDSVEIFTTKNAVTNKNVIKYSNSGVMTNWPTQRWYTGPKYILSQNSKIDELGMITTKGYKNFVPGSSDFSDTLFYFNIGLEELERYSTASQTISENKRVYFEGSNKGKLRKIISNSHLSSERHDTTYYNYKTEGTPHPVARLNMPNLYKGVLIGEDNPSRKIKTEYEYPVLIDSVMYDPGGIQYLYNENLEIIGSIEVPARYKYFLKSTIKAKFVLTDGTIKDSTLTINSPGFPKQPVITRIVFDRSGINDTLLSRTIFNEKGNLIYKVDPYGYYSEYKYDELGRMLKANLPGSFPTSYVTYVDTFEVRLNESSICERSILIRTNGDYYQNPEAIGIFSIGREIIGEEDRAMQKDAETELEQTDELIGGDPGSGGGGNSTPNTYYFAFFKDKIPTAKIISIPQAILRFRTKHYNVAPELNMKFKISAIVQEFQNGYLSYETIGTQIVDFQQNSLISIDVSQLLLSLKNENKDLYGFKFSADVDLYDQTKSKYFAFSVDTLPYLDCSLILEDIENSFTKGSFTYNYDDINRKVEINKRFNFDHLNPKRSIEILEYDVRGNLKKSKALDDLGVEETKSTMKYNYLGLNSKVTDAENRNLFNKYDYFSRAKETRMITDDAGAPKIRYEYNPIDHSTEYEKQTIFDESNNKTEKIIDKSGKVLREIRYDNETPFITTYTYNSLQQLTAVTTPNNKTTNYYYDDLGNISRKVDPNQGTTLYKYDRFNQLRFEVQNHQLQFNDSMMFNKYDNLRRLQVRGIKEDTEIYSELNPDLSYGFENDTSKYLTVNMYDKFENTGVFVHITNPPPTRNYLINNGNHKGRLVATAFRNKLGEQWSFKIYSYDALGRVDDFWIKYENTAWKWIQNEYDHAGNLTKQIIQNDMVYWNDYDSQGRLKEVRTSIQNNKSTAKLEAVYSYNNDNKISQLKYSDLKTTQDRVTYAYDSRGRLTSINELYTYVNGQNVIDDYPRFTEGLTYYPNSNIENQLINNKGLQNPALGDLNLNYFYDGLNRLTSVKNYGNDYEWYTYDPDGNFNTKTRPGKHMEYIPFEGTDRLQKVNIGGVEKGYQYDSRGNVISDGLRQISSISYDRRNLPLSMTTTNGTNFKYKYDDNGNRLLKQANGVKEFYLRDHTGKELAVYNLYTSRIKMANLYGNGLLGKANVRWDSVLTQVDPGNWEYVYSRTDERNYYIKDHLGNIRIVLDKNGEVVSAQDYYPFGEIISSRSYVTGGNVNDKYKFTEKERDTETNYDYFGARYYDSELGRWLQVDPLADKYPGWSPYNYTLNNPERFLDPNGGFVIENGLLKSYSSINFDLAFLRWYLVGTTNEGDDLFPTESRERAADFLATGILGGISKFLNNALNIIQFGDANAKYNEKLLMWEAEQEMFDNLRNYKYGDLDLLQSDELVNLDKKSNPGRYSRNRVLALNPEILKPKGKTPVSTTVTLISNYLKIIRDKIYNYKKYKYSLKIVLKSDYDAENAEIK